MTKLIELLIRYNELEDNKEKLYLKEAIALEAVPQQYKEEYCRDKDFLITTDPEELIK